MDNGTEGKEYDWSKYDWSRSLAADDPRVKDKRRIRRMMRKLEGVWEMFPCLSFGQLIWLVAEERDPSGQTDNYMDSQLNDWEKGPGGGGYGVYMWRHLTEEQRAGTDAETKEMWKRYWGNEYIDTPPYHT